MSLFSKSSLPALPEYSDVRDVVTSDRVKSFTPVIAGAAMVAMGLLMRRAKPDTLRLPEPGSRRKIRDVRSARDAAHVARDGVARVIPNNLTGSLGRTMILMGAATIAVRMLDELVDEDSALY